MATTTGGLSDIYFKPNAITTTTAIKGKDASQMGMDDFLNLLVAQMTNQDVMNPQENTEFIAQMAQFSSLQGIKTLTEYQLSNYAVSYAGKNVVIADYDSSGGIETITGMVETVTFYDGKPMVVVNGKAYDLHKVMEVTASPAKTEEAEEISIDEVLAIAEQAERDANSNALAAAAPYIGKTVTVEIRNKSGEAEFILGKVEGVSAQKGKAKIELSDGKSYDLDMIVTVWND